MDKKLTICLIRTKTEARDLVAMVVPNMVLPFNKFTASNGISIESKSKIDITDSSLKNLYLRGASDINEPAKASFSLVDNVKYDKIVDAFIELADIRPGVELDIYLVNTKDYIKDSTTLAFLTMDLGTVFAINNISIENRLRGASSYTTGNGITIKSASYPAYNDAENKLVLCGSDKSKDGQWLFMPIEKKDLILEALKEYSQRAGVKLTLTDITQRAKQSITSSNFTLKAILKVRNI